MQPGRPWHEAAELAGALRRTRAVLAREVSQLPGPLIPAALPLKWDLHKEGYLGTLFLDDTHFRYKCPSLPSVSGCVRVFLSL